MYRQQMLNAYSTNSEGLGSRKNNVVLKENEERGFKKQACKMAFFILSFAACCTGLAYISNFT